MFNRDDQPAQVSRTSQTAVELLDGSRIEALRFLLRDRDCAASSQDEHALRTVIGSIRHEVLDHVLALGEAHACQVLAAYQAHVSIIGHASFDGATFTAEASFYDTTFTNDARFDHTTFTNVPHAGVRSRD